MSYKVQKNDIRHRAVSKIVCHFSKPRQMAKTQKLGNLFVNSLPGVENLRLYGAYNKEFGKIKFFVIYVAKMWLY